MSNKIQMICSSVILVFAFMATGFADEHFPFLAEVSKGSVNVRAGSNTNFERIGQLQKGAKVVVLGRSYEWYKIQPLATTKEYIRSDYLRLEEGGNVARVLGDNVNIRSRPNADAASLGEVKQGDLVKVLQQAGENGWSLLAPVGGTVAWIQQDFLKEITADVPSSMLIQAPVWQPSVIKAETVKEIPVEEGSVKIVTSSVSLQGRLEPLAQAPREDVHYEIVIDDKSVYYLQDIPQISVFANSVVDVEGSVVPDWQKKSMYPLVHINKIVLVL